MAALRVPAACGVKVTAIVQLLPAATSAAGTQVPARVNSAALVPFTEIMPSVSATDPVLDTVAVISCELAPVT